MHFPKIVAGLLLSALVAAQEPERLVWIHELQSPCYGSGSCADIDGDGKLEIVFGTYFNDEQLYALNAEDGSLAWTFPSDGGPFDASLALCDLQGDARPEILAADSATGKLFCLDGAGQQLWSFQLPSGTDSPPAIADLDADGVLEIVIGTMWTRDGEGRVCVLNSASQELLWSRSIPGCVQSEPCLVELNDDGVLDVVVTSWRGDHAVHALDGATGATLWSLATEPGSHQVGMYHGVALAGRGAATRLLVATCAGQVLCLDRQGAVQWSQQLDAYLFAPPTVGDLDGDGRDEVLVAAQEMVALAVADGRELWRSPLGGTCTRGAVLADISGDGLPEVLLAAGTQVLALDATGQQLWSYEGRAAADPYESIDSAPLIADFDGDGQLELFAVTGRGHSGETQPENYGRAFLLRLGKGLGPDWTTFRGGLRRDGRMAARWW